MTAELHGTRVALLATDGVERIELEQPRGALHGAGARTEVIALHTGEINARQMDIDPAGTLTVDRTAAEASA
ncbi:peptidase C56, partial [Streptomyces nanshensis]